MEKLKMFFNRKNKILWIAIGLLVIIILAFVWRYALNPQNQTDSGNSRNSQLFSLNKTATPKKAICKLTGEEVIGNADRHTLAVMIENHPDARPQSGLNKASIIFEAVTEGGITRFLAIYGPNDAPEVGPIRSARSFFVDWAEGFDAYYAHAGQALDAGKKIIADKVMDLSGYEGGQRKQYRNVDSEHTLYNTTENLYKQAETKGFSKVASYTPWIYEKELTLENRGNQDSISINYGERYDVKWVYDKTTNIYNRFLDGAKHTDRTSSEQLTAKNVVIITVTRAPISLPGAKPTYKFDTIGTNKAIVISNGQKTEGTWKKTSPKDQIKFLDLSGNEINLTPGVTWVEVVHPEINYEITESIVVSTSTTTTAI